MIELLVGFGIASWMGAGGLYIFLLIFAFAFPRLFRVLYWMLMLPVMALGGTGLGWIFLGFFMGWSESTLNVSFVLSTIFAFAFCFWTDPKKS